MAYSVVAFFALGAGTARRDTAEERLSADYNSTFFLPSLAGLTPTITLGGYAEDEDFEQDSLFLFQGSGTPDRIDEGRDTQAFYTQLILDWRERVTLVAGFRLDESSTFGTEVNPRVGLAYRLPAIETKLHASYGTGSRRRPFSRTSSGAPLRSGTRTWISSVRKAGRSASINRCPSTIIRASSPSRTSPRISTISSASSSVRRRALTSSGRAFSTSSERRAAASKSGLRIVTPIGIGLRGSYTYLDTEVVESGPSGGTLFVEGEPLIRRPEHSGAFTIDYSVERWTASFNLTIKGSSIDLDFNTDPSGARVRLDGFAKADIALAYRLIENRLGMESFSITARGRTSSTRTTRRRSASRPRGRAS